MYEYADLCSKRRHKGNCEFIAEISACHSRRPCLLANVPAPVKNLFDRLLGTAIEETNTFPKPRLRGKQYILLTSCNTPAPFSWILGQSRGAVRNMDEFFKTAGMKRIGKVVYTNAKNKKELPKQTVKKIERCLKGNHP